MEFIIMIKIRSIYIQVIEKILKQKNGIKIISRSSLSLVANTAKTIQLPDSLEEISTIPNTIKELSFGKNLKTINATNLGGLLALPTLTSVTIDSENPNFTVVGNGIYNKEKTILKAVWGLPTTFNNMPTELKIVDNKAFGGQSKLSTLYFNSIESIGSNAFQNCTALSHIDLGSSLKKIDRQAFNGCSSLTSIDIPSSIEEIAYDAFGGWITAKEIRIHKPKDSILGMPWGANIGDRAIIWDE